MLSTLVIAGFILLYTAWDKKKGKPSRKLLHDFLLVRRGLDWTLVELNKVISLAGLLLILAGFLSVEQFEKRLLAPLHRCGLVADKAGVDSEQERNRTFLIGQILLITHTIYSAGKFWQVNSYT